MCSRGQCHPGFGRCAFYPETSIHGSREFLCRDMFQPHELDESELNQNEETRSHQDSCVSSPSGQKGRWWLPSTWPSEGSSWTEPAWEAPPDSSQGSAACCSHVLQSHRSTSQAGRLIQYLVQTDRHIRAGSESTSLYSLVIIENLAFKIGRQSNLSSVFCMWM